MGVQRCVEISGPDAEDFMNLLTPRDVSKVAVGQCRYIVMTNQDGGVINDPVMLRMAEDRFWLSTADGDMYLWAKGVSVFSDHDVRVETPDVYPLQIQGPASVDVMRSVFGDSVLDLKYYHWMHASVDGINVVISRTGYSAEIGFEVYLLGRKRGDDLWEIIMEAGAPFGLSPGSPNRIRRVEGGILDYGSDMTPNENPLELGMARLVNFEKSDFIGKAALVKIRDQGVKRKMVGIFFDGAPFEKNNEQRWPVYAVDGKGDNENVGVVTSAVYSPRLDRNIGFALLETGSSGIGTELTTDTPEGRRVIEVTTLTFVDHQKKKPRATLRV